jgi:hypothetical protein
MSELGPDSQPPQPVAGPPAPLEPARPVRWTRAGRLGTALCFGATVLVTVSLFLPLYIATIRFPQFVDVASGQRLILTSWGTRVEFLEAARVNADTGSGPFNGIPLLFAAAVLLTAAMLGVIVAARPSSTRFGRFRRLTTTVGAAFLAGTVWTIDQQVLSLAQNIRRVGQETTAEGAIGTGFWLQGLSVVLAIAAAVVTWRMARQDDDREREEPETLPMGIPVLVHRLPDAPVDKPEP